MPDGQSLEFSGVTKRFGAITAVAGLTAHIEPGRVTGFLGPNGAGKTTTLRILLGLVRATDGHATIGGKRYADLAHPLQTVGAVLEASSFHPGRTAAAHLKVYAQAAGLPNRRVDEVLSLVGLADAAGRKVGGFSLGMRQRLGLAYALLGDPGVLVLDEPANGLDPEGIRWMRGFLRDLAREGRTVLVSSHLLAEVQQTADALLIISQGRLVFQGSVDELADPSEYATVVDAPDRAALSAALQSSGVSFEVLRSGLTVRGVEPAAVGAAAAAAGVALSSLHRRGPALEEVFLDLVNGARVHPSAAGLAPASGAALVTEQAAPTETTDAETAAAEEPAVAEADAAAEVEAVAEPEVLAPPAIAEPEVAAEAELAAEPDAAAEPEVAAEPGMVAESELVAEPEAVAEPDTSAEAEVAAETTPEPAPEPEPTPEREDVAEPDATIEPESPGAVDVDVAEAVVAAGVPDEPDTTVEHESSNDSEPGTGTAAFAVASTGIIDIVPPSHPDDPPPDPDPDVEELGDIDEELSASEPADDDEARPWENREKTEADVEADRFFAAFDAGTEETGFDEPAAAEASVADAPSEEPARADEGGDER